MRSIYGIRLTDSIYVTSYDITKAINFGNGAGWIRDISQLSMESAVESNQPPEDLNRLTSAFSRETFLLLKDPAAFFNDRDSMSPEGED